MPDLDPTFCSTYNPIQGLDGYIADPTTDPDASFRDFLSRYYLWETKGNSNPGLAALWFWFHDNADAKRALEAGQAQASGRVRQDHCEIFLKFVNDGTAMLDETRQKLLEEEKKLPEKDAKDPFKLTPFEVAVRAFQMGLPLNETTRGLLNGACFLHNKVRETGVTGGTTTEIREFYAIPGYDMFARYQQDLLDPLWRGILSGIEDATEAARAKTINMEIALQLRLGRKKSPDGYPEEYQPTPIGSGIIIFGGE